MVIDMDKKLIIKKCCVWGAVIIGIYLFFRFVLKLILPFLIAFVIAFVLQRPIRLINARTGIGKRILSAVFVSVVVLFCGFVIFLLLNRLINEVERFAVSVSENSDQYVASFFAFIDRIAEKLPFIDEIGADLSETVSDAIKGILTTVTSNLPQIIGNLIGMLPEILLFTIILIMASYYFCADFDAGVKLIYSFMSPKAREAVVRFKERLADTGLAYLKACLILMLITYVELVVGFLMLGIPYSFTLSILIAAIDMLPILGVGTVLIPWAVWAWLAGDTYIAVGLIIINLTITVVRRFIEPRVIGSGIGLSPITTLVAMYIGFRLFGFTGLFFAPLAAILILHMLPSELAEKLGFRQKEKKEKVKSYKLKTKSEGN